MKARGGFGATTCERGFGTGGLTSASAGTAAAAATGAAVAAAVDTGGRFPCVAAGVGLAETAVGTAVETGARDVALSVEEGTEEEVKGCAASDVWLRRRSVQKAKINVTTSRAAANFPQGTGCVRPSGSLTRGRETSSIGRLDGVDVRFRKDRGGAGTYPSTVG